MANIQFVFTLNVADSIAEDVDQYWHSKVLFQSGVLASDVGQADSTINLNYVDPRVVPGTCLLIDNEPMTVVSVGTGTGVIQLQVSRGTSQQTLNGNVSFPLAVPAAHSASTQVAVLGTPTDGYPVPLAPMVAEALRPWMSHVIQVLGTKSKTLGASLSGVIG